MVIFENATYLETDTVESDENMDDITDNFYWNIGFEEKNSDYWDGHIDEVRISSVWRTQAWMTADYHTQANTDGFLIIGNLNAAPGVNTPPQMSSPYPTNESTGVEQNPQLSITISDVDDANQDMNITWYWGTDPSCPYMFAHNLSVSGGTYKQLNTANFSTNYTTYYWQIILNDGNDGYDNEIFHFKTSKSILNIDITLIDNSTVTTGVWNTTEHFEMASSGVYNNNGISLHHVGRKNTGSGEYCDRYVYYDENTNFGTEIKLGSASNQDHGSGSVTIDKDGTFWYAYGGYFSTNPLDVYTANDIGDYLNWTLKLNNVDSSAGTTPIIIATSNDSLLLFFRNGANDNAATGTQFMRYYIPDIEEGANKDYELLDGMTFESAALCPNYLWGRYDSRYHYAFLTGSYKHNNGDGGDWGSFPVVYTDDNGTTWRKGDGTEYGSLPIEYTDADIPFDNIVLDDNVMLYGAELGVTPNGTIYQITRYNDAGAGDYLWTGRNVNNEWIKENFSFNSNKHTSFTMGTTEDYVFIAYAEGGDDKRKLKVIASDDDGISWTNPTTLFDLDNEDLSITGVSYCQPLSYENNEVRLFYSIGGTSGSDRSDVSWCSFRIGPELNNLPELLIANVYPPSGVDSYTNFNFNVTWKDTDGEDPTDGYLSVKIIKDGWDTNQSMSWVSGSNVTGANYTYTTLLTSGSYSFYIYAYDSNNYNYSGSHNGPEVSSQSYVISVSQSDLPSLWFNITSEGHHTQSDVNATGQTSETPALAIENQGNVPINLTIDIASSLSSGLTLKWDDDNNPTGATEVTTDPVQIQENLAILATKNIWLWMDFLKVGPETGEETLHITSDSGTW